MAYCLIRVSYIISNKNYTVKTCTTNDHCERFKKQKKWTLPQKLIKAQYHQSVSPERRRTNSFRVREVVVAGGRRFQDEAARYENIRRDSDKRRAGSSSSPATVARVARCDTSARRENSERMARGACGSLSARNTPMQSRRTTRSRTPSQPSDSSTGEM